MYVCNCHGLNEKRVSAAARRMPATLARMYDMLAVRPQCGKCVRDVRDIMVSHRQAGGKAATPNRAA